MIGLKTHFGHYFRILHTGTDQTMTQALASMELTGAQGQILGFLARHEEPPCARDIEELFHLSHPTVSGLLARLEKKGFIEFRPDEQDRRCKRIFLLPKSQEVLSTMHRTITDIEHRLVQDFSPEEKQQFEAFLNRAIQNMGYQPCKRKPKEESDHND